MAKFNLTGSKTVAELKKEFNEAFGSSIKVYNGRNKAEDSETLGNLGLKADTEFECRSSRTVGSFKVAFAKMGLKVKVFTKDEWVAVLDGITLETSGKIPNQSTGEKMKEFLAYKREDKEDGKKTADNVNAIDMENVFTNLKEFSLHDIASSIKIRLYDAQLNNLDEKAVNTFAAKLKEKFVAIKPQNHGGECFDQNKEFYVYDNNITLEDYYAIPSISSNLHDDVAVFSQACIELAKELNVSCIFSVIMSALHLGNSITLWETSACINQKTSFSEMYLYEGYNEEYDEYVFVRDIDDDEEVEDDQRIEWLSDLVMDGFDEYIPDGFPEDEDLQDDYQSNLYNIIFEFFQS